MKNTILDMYDFNLEQNIILIIHRHLESGPDYEALDRYLHEQDQPEHVKYHTWWDEQRSNGVDPLDYIMGNIMGNGIEYPFYGDLWQESKDLQSNALLVVQAHIHDAEIFTDIINAVHAFMKIERHGYPGKHPWETPEEWDAFLDDLARDLSFDSTVYDALTRMTDDDVFWHLWD